MVVPCGSTGKYHDSKGEVKARLRSRPEGSWVSLEQDAEPLAKLKVNEHLAYQWPLRNQRLSLSRIRMVQISSSGYRLDMVDY